MDLNELRHNNQRLDIEGKWIEVEAVRISSSGSASGSAIFTMVDGRRFEYKLSGFNPESESGEWWDVDWDSEELLLDNEQQ